MAIQNRRGNIIDLDPHKLLPGEFGISLDNKKAHICFEAGNVKTMATEEDFQVKLDSINDNIARAEAAAIAAESLIVNKAGINDLTPTLTEAYSGVKTEQLYNDAKTFASGLFSGVTSFKIEVVTELPTVDIQTMTIYLVPKFPGIFDNYDEYMYIDSIWEHIGSTEIDLSNYYTKSESVAKGEFFINVKDFGAVGDGITDDTVSIQNALNITSSAPHSHVFFPKGTYLLTSLNATDTNCHLYIYNVHNVKLSGEGNATVLKANTTDKDLIRTSGGSSNISLQDLKLDRIEGAISGGNGIHFYNWYACPRWSSYNVTISKQYDGIRADSSRPQASFWESCRFDENVNNGVNLVMNNDEFFSTCTFINNGSHGISIGGSDTLVSDGSVYINNCCVYFNQQGGLACLGTVAQPSCNVFINGGIFDNNVAYGIYIKNTFTVQINTTITWTNGRGLWLDSGAKEIRIDGTKISDSSEEGLYIASGTKYISGSGLSILSNGRSSLQNYYGVYIVGNVTYVNFTGGMIGNGDDTATVTRSTQEGGIYIDGTGGLPNYIEFIGISFPNLLSNYRFTTAGTVGGGLHLLEAQGASLALQQNQYLGFGGSTGGTRMRFNSTSGNVEFESNFGASSGAWNNSHLVLGTYHLWVDSTGDLRIKNGAPTSDTDGNIVGV